MRRLLPAFAVWIALASLACGSPSPRGSSSPPSAGGADAGEPNGDAGHEVQGKLKTLFVREELANCTGVAPRKCMQVRESASDPWTLFYDSIEGFKYEEHYQYELRVDVTENPHPPADGSSLRYRLVTVVSKSPK